MIRTSKRIHEIDFFCHWNCFCIQYYYVTIFGLLVTSRLKSWSNRMKYRLLCSNHLFKILIAKLRPRYHRHCTEPEGIEQIWNLLRVKYLLRNVKEDIICISNAMVFLILPDIDYMQDQKISLKRYKSLSKRTE